MKYQNRMIVVFFMVIEISAIMVPCQLPDNHQQKYVSRETLSLYIAINTRCIFENRRNPDAIRHFILTLGAGVTPAQGSVKPTAGFTFN